ncbi:Asp/Glu racemase [Amylibacter ulvae]|uniref:Asp/Glu racemase n=1 Tax=Paramylibacter ulvae TaxID=1651968 RepID=A0ABQ3D3L0_9RHOB|nr:aspartate/glutamate racemase family protein [Amylibacter ulvae]GHA53033.1 Asp/Glu racemase [Amylibacter ulvae]
MNDYTYTRTELPHINLGLIVLQTDERIEHDFQRLFSPKTTKIMVSRISNADTITRDTLNAMKARLPKSAVMFPRVTRFGAVGYGCTSASSVIGADGVADAIKSGCNTEHVTNPLSAVIAACRHLNITNLALVSPYIAAVNATLQSALSNGGINTAKFASFNESLDENVARISPDDIARAAIDIGSDPACDGVFLSCTNLDTLDVIDVIERAVNKPVISSNQALAWHMAKLTNTGLGAFRPGRLLQER